MLVDRTDALKSVIQGTTLDWMLALSRRPAIQAQVATLGWDNLKTPGADGRELQCTAMQVPRAREFPAC